jgi:hydroxypyruvate isomerase
MFPYEFRASDIAAALKDNGPELVLHNLPADDWASGDRGTACDPARVQEFRDGVEKAIDYAQALGCPKVNCLAGKLPDGVRPEKARAVLVENFSYAAEKLAAANVGELMEPVNSRAIPGFFVDRPSLGFATFPKSNRRTSRFSTTSFTRR